MNKFIENASGLLLGGNPSTPDNFKELSSVGVLKPGMYFIGLDKVLYMDANNTVFKTVELPTGSLIIATSIGDINTCCKNFIFSQLDFYIFCYSVPNMYEIERARKQILETAPRVISGVKKRTT